MDYYATPAPPVLVLPEDLAKQRLQFPPNFSPQIQYTQLRPDSLIHPGSGHFHLVASPPQPCAQIQYVPCYFYYPVPVPYPAAASFQPPTAVASNPHNAAAFPLVDSELSSSSPAAEERWPLDDAEHDC
jgi:hypothetical protein